MGEPADSIIVALLKCILAVTLLLISMEIIIIFVKWLKERWKHSFRQYKFSLKIIFNSENKFKMPSINQVVLTDTTPHNGNIVLVDNYGNEYTGTLQNPQLTGFDPALDKVNIDAANPHQLDVQMIGGDGTTTATLNGDFLSSGNATSRPNPDATKPGSKAIPDGTVIAGVSCKVSITNVISRTFALEVKFP